MKIQKMIYLKIPNALKINAFIEKEKQLPYTYTPIGGTKSKKIDSYDNDFAKIKLGEGDVFFEKAKKLICDWKMFPLGWTKILGENKSIQEGTSIVMMARFMGVWFRNSCKIVYVIDEKNRFGFAYGTLPGHIESGEELFLVEINEQKEVFYSIKAFSRPRHFLAKIGYPIIRILQEKFRQDSMKQMVKMLDC
jgi:uncharacterized protein (UPF0548 family)